MSTGAKANEVMLEKARASLIAADSLLSLIGYRYSHALPEDLGTELRACSLECRKIATEIQARPSRYTIADPGRWLGLSDDEKAP